MNHVRMTLVITAIVAAASLATVTFAVPQQAMAGGYGHHNHDNHSDNGIKVDQQINQLNACTDSLCVNDANNTADIHH
jgi:hypothetical protein